MARELAWVRTELTLLNLTLALRLGRISNLPTVWTNVLVGVLLAGGSLADPRLPLLMLALSLFYVGGMFLNDAFDREFDAQHRPERPIPSGQVSARQVFVIGFGLLAIGHGGRGRGQSRSGRTPGMARARIRRCARRRDRLLQRASQGQSAEPAGHGPVSRLRGPDGRVQPGRGAADRRWSWRRSHCCAT